MVVQQTIFNFPAFVIQQKKCIVDTESQFASCSKQSKLFLVWSSRASVILLQSVYFQHYLPPSVPLYDFFFRSTVSNLYESKEISRTYKLLHCSIQRKLLISRDHPCPFPFTICTMEHLDFLFLQFCFHSNVNFSHFYCYSVTVVPIFPPFPSSAQPTPCSDSQVPHCCACPWVIHTCALSTSMSAAPFPFFPPLTPFPDSGHFQSILCFYPCGSVLFVSVFCSLDSS